MRFTLQRSKILLAHPLSLHTPTSIVLVHGMIYVSLFDVPPPILILIPDPHGGLSILNRGVRIKVSVNSINKLLVALIKTSTPGALMLMCGLMSLLRAGYWCREFANSRVSVFARLPQRRLGFRSQTFRGIHVGADTSR